VPVWCRDTVSAWRWAGAFGGIHGRARRRHCRLPGCREPPPDRAWGALVAARTSTTYRGGVAEQVGVRNDPVTALGGTSRQPCFQESCSSTRVVGNPQLYHSGAPLSVSQVPSPTPHPLSDASVCGVLGAGLTSRRRVAGVALSPPQRESPR